MLNSQSHESLSGDFAATTGFFPESASPRLVEAMKEYLARLEDGKPVNRREFLERYADIAADVEKCLGGLEFIQGAVPRFSEVEPVATPKSLEGESAFKPVGDFRIVREIGRGGMGVVYEAEQLSLSRRVALKVLPFGAALDSQSLQRFRNESLAAAQLDHPHIVHVYGVGCDRGVHYYAMRYIEGRSLAEVIAEMTVSAKPFSREAQPSATQVGCAERVAQLQGANADVDFSTGRLKKTNAGSPDIALGCASRLNAGASQVAAGASRLNAGAETVAFKKVPLSTDRHSNRAEFYRSVARLGIQVAEALDYAHSRGIIHRDVKPGNLLIDELGKVWVADFGVAHVNSVDATLTVTGQMVGTLRYMSPEQITAERGLVDQRSDIYSLGATLYELLTLAPVYAGNDRAKLLAQITQDDPAPPRRIDRSIPEELETIVLKCLEKEPTRRYATAQALADDMGRFLANRPIVARRAGPTEMFRKWSRRHQTGVLASMATLFLATVVLATSTLWVLQEREQTARERNNTRQQTELADTRQKTLRQQRYVANIHSADNAWRRGAVQDARDRLAECIPNEREEDLRGFEWYLLSRMSSEIEYRKTVWNRHKGVAYCARFSPDGKLLATCGQDGVRVWNWPTGEPRAHLTPHADDVRSVAFSPDGRLLASASDDHTARVWSTATWEEATVLEHSAQVPAVAFSPDGQTLATAERGHSSASRGNRNAVRLWNVQDWTEKQGFDDDVGDIESLAFAPDGSTLGVGSHDGKLFDLAKNTFWMDLRHDTKVNCIAFSRTRPIVAGGSDDGSVCIVELGNALRREKLMGHTAPVESVAFSPHDDTLVTASRDGTLRLWEFTRAGYEMHNRGILVDTAAFCCATFTPDGRSIVTSSRDGSIKHWKRTQIEVRQRYVGAQAPRYYYPVAFTHDGKALAIIDKGVKLIDVETAREIRRLTADTDGVGALAISPDGTRLAAGVWNGREPDHVIVWNTDDWLRRSVEKSHSNNRFLSFIPGAKHDVVIGRPLRVMQGDPSNGVLQPDSDDKLREADFVAFSPDGRTAATIRVDRGVSRPLQISDWPSGRVRAKYDGSFATVAFSRDGATLAAGRHDGMLALWTGDWEEEPLVFSGHTSTVQSLAFSADGKTLASAGDEGAVKLWHISTGRELMTLDSQAYRAWCVRFSPDGSRLASSGEYLGDAQRLEVLIWNSGDKQQVQESTSKARKQVAAHDQKPPAERETDLRERLYVASINVCYSAWKRGDLEAARGHLAQCRPMNGEKDYRGFEWRLLARWLESVPLPWAHHRGEVYFARFSPDGKLLATCGQDGVTIRNFATGERVARLKGHIDDVNGVDFSPDGKILATASDDETVKMWDTTTWTERQSLPQTGCAVGVAFTPDGKRLAVAERMAGPDQTRLSYGSNVVRLWDCATREIVRELGGHQRQLQGVAISADGRWVASACDDGLARVWDLGDFSLRFSFEHPHPHGVRAVAFAHSKPLLATVDGIGRPRIFSLDTGQAIENLSAPGKIAESIAWAPDDTALATAARDGLVRVWELGRKPQPALNAVTYRHGAGLWCVVFSPDGGSLVSTARNGAIRRWDRSAPQDRVRLLHEASEGDSHGFFDFVEGQPTSLLACRDKLELIDAATGSVLRSLSQPGERITKCAMSRSGRWLATLGIPRLKIRDVQTGAVKWSAPTKTQHATALVFDPRDDDTLIASIEQEPPFLLNVITENKQLLSIRADHVSIVSPNGKTAIVGNTKTGTSWLWDRDSGKPLFEENGLDCEPAFARDGRMLAYAVGNGTIHLRQADSWEETTVIRGNPVPVIRSLAFSADGKTLAGACLDGTVRLWHVSTGRELLSLEAHSRSAELVRFSPDGTVLASSGLAVGTVDRREILIWNTDGK